MNNNVPIIVQQGTSQSFWLKRIITGLRKSAEKCGYELNFISNSDLINGAEYANEASVSVIVIGHMVEWLQKTINCLITKGFHPIAVNACISPEMLRHCSGVSFRIQESVESAVKYLLSANRNHIALLGTNSFSLADRLKEETFKRFAKQSGMQKELLIFHGENPLWKCVDAFIKDFIEKDIDAVICANDTVAIYLINRMMNDGFKIPENLYVIGMGNSELGQRISIPLSSVDFEYEKLGHQALETWRLINKGYEKMRVDITLPCKFIIRESTDNYVMSEQEFPDVSTYSGANIETKINSDAFYEDSDVCKIINLEVFLCGCDETDYHIIEEILRGNSDTKMAELLNISDRAIRYRINKMTKKLGVQSREEIANIISELRAFNT